MRVPLFICRIHVCFCCEDGTGRRSHSVVVSAFVDVVVVVVVDVIVVVVVASKDEGGDNITKGEEGSSKRRRRVDGCVGPVRCCCYFVLETICDSNPIVSFHALEEVWRTVGYHVCPHDRGVAYTNVVCLPIIGTSKDGRFHFISSTHYMDRAHGRCTRYKYVVGIHTVLVYLPDHTTQSVEATYSSVWYSTNCNVHYLSSNTKTVQCQFFRKSENYPLFLLTDRLSYSISTVHLYSLY